MYAARIIFGILIALALVWAFVVVIVAVRSYFLMFRPRCDSADAGRAAGLAQGEFDEKFLSLGWESRRVRSPRGYELAVSSLAGNAEGKTAAGTVIFVHGFTATHYNMLKYAIGFHDRGWNAVAYDLAGHGDSVVPRSISRAPSFGFYEKDDLAAVVAWARTRFPGPGPTVLVGESMGAATVLQYAPLGAPRGAASSQWAVDAIIADCPFTSAAEELTWRLAAEGVPRIVAGGAERLVSALLSMLRGFRASEADSARAVLESAVPILFVHGGDDSYVPTAMSIRMAEERKRSGVGPTELLVVPGARHAKSVLVDPPAWFSTVFAFIDRYAHGRIDS